jgi:hypothetical protein
MSILAQFLLRLAFGLAVGMAVTSSKQVSSGFFRNHLYVTLGLATLASLALMANSPIAMWFAIAAAVFSYIGSVCWLYDAYRFGIAVLYIVVWATLLAGILAASASAEIVSLTGEVPSASVTIHHITPITTFQVISWIISGLLLGLPTAAMLLGHWYLNSPGMELGPLRRLLVLSAIAVLLQAIVSAVGLTSMWQSGITVPVHWILLRWSFGIVGVAVTLWMAWQTLKIPNTQSATGILYVAVIGVFIGELAASLLSAESAFPL